MKQYTKQYIGGVWREGTGTAMLDNISPFTGELLYSYRSASKADVDEAYEVAQRVQQDWAATTPGHKKELLEKLMQVWLEMKDDFFSVLIEEGGSTKAKYEFSYYDSVNVIQDALHYPYMMDGKIMPSNIPGKDNYVFKTAKGVVCVIAPFNFPVLLAMRSVVPAIACGNAVILKPATDTPASAMLIAEAFDRAGFPKGLISTIAGKGSVIGDYIVEHPVPAMISFTGSSEVGQHIGALAGAQIKDVCLELGGNNTMIVLDDADVDQAAKAAIFGTYCHQGQVCMCLNRIIATPKVYDAFAEKFVAYSKAQKVGNPAEDDTFIGPIQNASQVEGIEKIIADTVAAGATVALAGKTEGSLISPWVFTDVTNDMPAAKLEVFGPVCALIRAKDEDDAIAIANDTKYGLSNSVFTQDLYRGLEVAKRMDSGMVHVNDQPINHEPHVMFGGAKFSGIGRFNGKWAVDKFTTDKWISVQTKDRF